MGRKSRKMSQRNFTDPDSRIMPGPGGKEFHQSYNCQAAVDSAHQVIVAADVTKQPSDHGWALPLVQQIENNTGSLPKEASADAGYYSGGSGALRPGCRPLSWNGATASAFEGIPGHLASGPDARKLGVDCPDQTGSRLPVPAARIHARSAAHPNQALAALRGSRFGSWCIFSRSPDVSLGAAVTARLPCRSP